MTEFQIGDHVEIVDCEYSQLNACVGFHGTIDRIAPNGRFHIHFDEDGAQSKFAAFWLEEELSLVLEDWFENVEV